VWADTLLHAEQQHLLRLLIWSALSILAATAIGVLLAARGLQSALLRHFAIQMAAWGGVLGVIGAIGWRAAHLRDISGMTRIERVLWLNLGLDVGYTAVGVVLAVSGWLFAKRMAAVGAGTAIIVQGLAILVIDLQFAAVISR
jgi:type III secretory pathway component EscS